MRVTTAFWPDADAKNTAIEIRRLADKDRTIVLGIGSEVTMFPDLPFVLRLRDVLNAFVAETLCDTTEAEQRFPAEEGA